MTSEIHETYNAIINFMLEYYPLKIRDEINIVAADGAVIQYSVTEIYNLLNVKYMTN